MHVCRCQLVWQGAAQRFVDVSQRHGTRFLHLGHRQAAAAAEVIGSWQVVKHTLQLEMCVCHEAAPSS